MIRKSFFFPRGKYFYQKLKAVTDQSANKKENPSPVFELSKRFLIGQ